MSNLRKTWKTVRAAAHPTAVLVFKHGIETLAVQAESPEHADQLKKLLVDLEPHVAGVYDQTVPFFDLVEDVQHLSACLGYGETYATFK